MKNKYFVFFCCRACGALLACVPLLPAFARLTRFTHANKTRRLSRAANFAAASTPFSRFYPPTSSARTGPSCCPAPQIPKSPAGSADTSSRDTRSDAMFNARVATIMDLRQRGVINQETFDEGMKNLVKALTSSPLL